MSGFQAVSQILADRQSTLQVFFRDDDAGWADERLQQLIDEFISQDLPLDIAAIPEAVSERTAEVINAAMDSSDKIAVHQHGFTHTNHQQSGRSSEFGSDRSFQQQRRDIAAGKSRLTEMFGTRLKSIFTPPWNRCSKDTAAALQLLDIRFLSRIVGSDNIDSDLAELPVSIDWLKKRKGVSLNTAELIAYICEQLSAGEAVIGIMLHHEHMDADNRKLLLQFIATLKESQKVSFHTMEEVADLLASRDSIERGSESVRTVEKNV